MLKRLSFSLEAAGILYMICALVSLIRLWHESSLNIFSVVGVLSVPAIGALLFILASILVPGMLGSCKHEPPLNVTLPIVYLSLMFVSLELGPGSELSIVRLHQLYSSAMLWEESRMLAICGGLQVAAFSALAWKGERQPKAQPVE